MIAYFCAASIPDDDPGIFQDFEVLGYVRLGKAKTGLGLGNATFSLQKPMNEPHSGRMGQGLEYPGRPGEGLRRRGWNRFGAVLFIHNKYII